MCPALGEIYIMTALVRYSAVSFIFDKLPSAEMVEDPAGEFVRLEDLEGGICPDRGESDVE